MKNICVFGASSDDIREEFKEAAFALGKFLGENGYGLVFGGGATGLMGQSARGYRAAVEAASLIGVAPRFFDEPGVLYEKCTRMIWTETMRERKEIMENLADAFVVLPGGIGTFEEFFEVFTLRQLGRHDKPILIFNVDGYYSPMEALLNHTVKEGMMTGEAAGMAVFVKNLEEFRENLKMWEKV